MAGSEENQSDLDEMGLGEHEEEAYYSDDNNFDDSQVGILERIARNFEAKVEKKTEELRNADIKKQVMKRDIKYWEEMAHESEHEVDRLLEKIVMLQYKVRELEEDKPKNITKSEQGFNYSLADIYWNYWKEEVMVKEQEIINLRQLCEAQKYEVKSWKEQVEELLQEVTMLREAQYATLDRGQAETKLQKQAETGSRKRYS